jgi:hypothetical protein
MKNLVTFSALLGIAVTSTASVWDLKIVEGLLSGANAVPPNSSPALGGELGTGIRYDDVANRLHINLVYGIFGWPQLEGDFQTGQISLGGPGEVGPQVLDLTPMNLVFAERRGFILGSGTISEANEAQLFAGNFYINITTTKYPTGEIRGQLAVVPEPGTWALMAAGLGGMLWFRRK